ncbi:glycosyltransferase family 2 protein [Psychrobium sp. nBUS_13]|uniref:glycosyltransferase family 2 protein n=1 Tax=Psychrobium sp. nBUS_13 TaxID=3395319 RepID=UPI003EB81C5D
MSKLISIITASYNSSQYIQAVYDSLSAQSYENWEWLVTDDCSTDETRNILNRISLADKRVVFFCNKINSGAAVSRNVSLSKSNGEYIAFIDSDDLWEKNKLELQLNFMKDNNFDFSFTSFKVVDSNGISSGKVIDNFKNVKKVNYNDMLKKKATLGCSTVMLKKSSFGDISMPLLRTGQDYALWLKLLKSCKCAVLYPKPLTSYRILPNSISRNKFKKAMRQWEIYRNVEELKLSKSIVCFFHYGYRAIFRR